MEPGGLPTHRGRDVGGLHHARGVEHDDAQKHTWKNPRKGKLAGKREGKPAVNSRKTKKRESQIRIRMPQEIRLP